MSSFVRKVLASVQYDTWQSELSGLSRSLDNTAPLRIFWFIILLLYVGYTSSGKIP